MRGRGLVVPLLAAAVFAVGAHRLLARREADAALHARLDALTRASAEHDGGDTRAPRGEGSASSSGAGSRPPNAGPSSYIEAAPTRPRGAPRRDGGDAGTSEYERRFNAEPIDPEWALSASGAVRSAMTAALPPGGAILDLACRTSLCRAEVEYDDSVDAHNTFVGGLYGDEPESAMNQLSDGAACSAGEAIGGGRTRYVVYIVRKGAPPAQPAP